MILFYGSKVPGDPLFVHRHGDGVGWYPNNGFLTQMEVVVSLVLSKLVVVVDQESYGLVVLS